ncbi:hypothetical protein [Herbiconiux sp. YIM B11900]|uniref:hypothetical protein n=1 Tax=Herbiconiux sp. YIM B11900 TaxID=3404131 RepID=UPI003F874B43
MDWDEVARLTRAGFSAQQIAVICRCSARTVARIRVETGTSSPLRPHQSEPIDRVRLAQAQTLLEDGASFNEISRTLNISLHTLRKYFPGRALSRDEADEHRRMQIEFNRIPNHLNRKAA